MREAALRKNSIPEKDQFYYDVLEGLSREDKKLHPKYFYDKKGSQYFDQICHLDEYYPYKTELSLLPKVAMQLSDILTEKYALVEFGAGSLLKVKPLLQNIKGIEQFTPIDISGEHLRSSCQTLEDEFPNLGIHPVEGDFSQPIALKQYDGLKRIGFFPGSTIGNFTPTEAGVFLKNARETVGENNYLLIGVDTKKSPQTLHNAYNDKEGVTAKFNLNILERINEYFDNPMDADKFEHYAFYNTLKGCIEMHLVCLEEHSVVLDDVVVQFDRGESIHTESSYKYSPEEFKNLSEMSGWHMEKAWLAPNDMFAIYLLCNRAD